MTTTNHELADGRRLTIDQDDDNPTLVVYRLDDRTLSGAEAEVLRRELRDGASIGATLIEGDDS